MANINSVIIGGNLARDPEVRVTPKGTSVAQFTVANNRKWYDDSGAGREDVAFIDCEAWGKTAENIAKFFAKGRPIIVEGRLKHETWEDKQTGQKRRRVKVSVSAFHFVGSKQDVPATNETGRAASAAPATSQGNTEEDIPF